MWRDNFNIKNSTFFQIINGYDYGDSAMVGRGLNHPCLQNLDVEYQRLAKRAKMPDEDDLGLR